MTTVFIVSSSPSAREALRRLAESPEVRVGGDGDDLEAFAASATPAAVLLVDDGEALALLQEGEDRLPPAIVLVSDDVDAVAIDRVRAIDPPGWAILPRGATAGELRAAIVAAGAGLAVLPAAVAVAPFSVRRHESGDDGEMGADDDVVEEALTGREHEVLEWLGRGLSNREIGVRLGISEHTAKFHVASVLAKLGAHNRAEAVRRGIRRGLVMV